jgi:hypothetical protein
MTIISVEDEGEVHLKSRQLQVPRVETRGKGDDGVDTNLGGMKALAYNTMVSCAHE